MNKKLTKKQLKIYQKLLSKPGYLKKGIVFIDTLFPNDRHSDVDKAFQQAKIDYKLDQEYNGETLEEMLTSSSKQDKFFKDNKKRLESIKPIKKLDKFDKSNVLAISDLHLPFCKEGYLEHCIAIRDKYNCGTIVVIGDEVDLCGVSQWEKDPDGFSAGTEASLAQEQLKEWYKTFPEAFVCIGNHTARPFRQAKANGIPKKFIKSYEEAWEAPEGWRWAESWDINNVHYTHGTGYSGPNAAIRIATRHRQNTCIGHIHSEAGIQYSASKIDLVWGMQLGGALNDNTYAAYYAKDQLKKSIIGCGVILDSGRLPIYEPMKL